MKSEEGWKMYIDIKHLKSKGFSNTKIADMLDVSRPTVIKYLNMEPEEFYQEMEERKYRKKKPQKYENDIVGWLKDYPQMTAAQVFDWLEEKYGDIDFNEATMRNYVRFIRKEHGIAKDTNPRQYEASDDPPMGKQMQVDFGQKKVFDNSGKELTIYVMCFILSHSRFKYCEWQLRPFKTVDIIKIHENALEYFGGYPAEAVYDQDTLILVSENHGDLIYTKEFASYLQKRKLSVRMCRKADPESKGKVEKCVDYVKDNFASNRIFHNIDKWNEACLKWLKRRGNGKVHQTTRKIPAEVFQEERKYLKPVLEKIIDTSHTVSITYQVRKDNTVPIQGNRYTVPTGTYKGPYTNVSASKLQDKYIAIFDLETGEEIARHEIPQSKGNLVKNNNHRRDKSKKIQAMIDNVLKRFNDEYKARTLIDEIRNEKPRYIRDQLMVMDSVLTSTDENAIHRALDYCLNNKLVSAVDFKDAANHYSKIIDKADNTTIEIKGITESATSKISSKVQVRSISEYVNIMNGNSGGK
ncbi:IS21 family transposase [Tissierella creatinini]|nr:IS21 family transposase [Tissierella creatinini]TJX62902.1 IS21 family transposase [Soehngenia saccharolytica]